MDERLKARIMQEGWIIIMHIDVKLIHPAQNTVQ
jgi:hypothetical protein